MQNANVQFVTFDAQDVITTSGDAILRQSYIKPASLIDADWDTGFFIFPTAMVEFYDGAGNHVDPIVADANYQLDPDGVNAYVEDAYFVIATSGTTDTPEGSMLKTVGDILYWLKKFGLGN